MERSELQASPSSSPVQLAATANWKCLYTALTFGRGCRKFNL